MSSFYETSILSLNLSRCRDAQVRKHLNDFIKKYKGFSLVSFSFADEDTVIFVWRTL